MGYYIEELVGQSPLPFLLIKQLQTLQPKIIIQIRHFLHIY